MQHFALSYKNAINQVPQLTASAAETSYYDREQER